MADKKQRTALWKGLNRMPYIGDGEMRDMRNLSSDAYPFITTRRGRKPYTFITKIPSPEGEAYRDIAKLPEPCIEEEGNVYKYLGNGLVSGAFYEYSNGEWKQVDIPISKTVISLSNGLTLLSGYYTVEDSNNNDAYTTKYPKKNIGKLVKYTGNSTEMFLKDGVYKYHIDVWYGWKESTSTSGSVGNYEVMPEPSADIIGKKYTYKGETTGELENGRAYVCYRYMQGRWELVEGDFIPTTEFPQEAADGDTLRWCGDGDLVNGSYYQCCEDSGVTFYFLCTKSDEAISRGYLPPIEKEVTGTIYHYTGPNVGEFAKCYSNNEYYDWKVVSHPEVKRTVTLKDYLDNYEGSGLKEILEIGSLNGSLAALIRDNTGEAKLYYNQKLYGNIPNLTEESGKKLVMVGNRLVVGESGSYIHVKDGDTEFMRMADTFSLTVRAEKQNYGGNFTAKDRTVYSSASGNSNGVEFILYGDIYRPGKGEVNPNGMLEKLAEALSTPGMGFVAYGSRSENARKQYLKLTSVEFKKEDFLLGYPDHEEYNEYTSTLIIKAEGVEESFDWNIEERYDDITFESTDPHYYDVVAWKKRLWGYQNNVFFGTVQDIWDSKGVVDWNTGNNTYTEAISQPLWQGGDITGVAALMNGLVFFKEDSITVVQGNYPAVMSSNTIPCMGLPPENRRTVAVGNEAVYYLGRNGVMRFDGGIPRCISQEAKINGTKAVGFSDGEKYYLSLKEADGKYALFVYDITFETWHKEECDGAISFVMLNGELHMAMGDEIYNLYAPQEDVPWEFELWYDEGTHCKKKYKEITVRGTVGDCELWLKADDGEWKFIGAVTDKMIMKFIPFDCEELSLKLKGKGKCEIKSIDRTFEIVE